MRVVHVVLPGAVDDPYAPSGGNTYDRRVCAGLAQAGWSVREHAVPGAWPSPEPDALTALAGTLAALPDGATVLLDGLVACAAPEIVEPAARRLHPVVLVHLPLGDEVGLAPGTAAVRQARERRTLGSAAAMVATSAWTARRLIEQHGLPAGRIHVATPGVDAAPLAAGTAAGSQLLCVAAVTPLKGQHLLVQALASLGDTSWSCRFVGSLDRAPRYVHRVRQAANGLGLDGRVRWTGPRTGTRLAATYATADLVLLASRAEAYGMVLTEALARGVPVLATDVGGVREALGRAPDGSLPGLLVPPDDPAALADALHRWLTGPGLRRRLRDAARARRATLSGWDDTVRALTEVLDAVRPVTGRPV